jgi:hypothetical protein
MQGNAARTARNARKTPAGIAAEQRNGAFAVCEVGAYQMRRVIKPNWSSAYRSAGSTTVTPTCTPSPGSGTAK